MSNTINRHLAKLLNSSGLLNTGKIPTDYITNAHIADNTIATSQLHSTFTIGAGHIPANTVTISHLAVTDGSAGQVLKTDGSGNLSFTTIESDKISEGNSYVEVVDTGSNGTVTIRTEGADRWQVTSAGHFLPTSNAAFDIGSATNKVRDLYVDDNSIHIGSDTKLSIDSDGEFQVTDNAGAPKKIKVDEIEIGTGNDKIILKKGSDGKLESREKKSGVLQTARKTFIIGENTTSDITEGSNLYYTDSRVSTRADTILNHDNHSNITVTKSGNELRFSAAAQYGDSDVASYLSSQGYDTKTNIVNAVTNGAPGALDTLNELAEALGDDANFSSTVTNSIATKWTQDNTKISQWDTAYSWGDHGTEGYLKNGFSATSATFTSGLNIGDANGGTTNYKRPNANYLRADGTGGYFIFVTNGRSTSYANRALAITTDNDLQVGRNVVAEGVVISNTAGSSFKGPLYIQRQNDSGEGGEISLYGSNGHTSHTLDTVNGSFRIFDTGGTFISGNTGYGLNTTQYRVGGQVVISNTRVLQNVTGNISLFTNDSGYLTGSSTLNASRIGNGTLNSAYLDGSAFKNRGSVNVNTTSDGSQHNPFDDAHVETKIAENGSRLVSYTGASAALFTVNTGGSASVMQWGAHYDGNNFYMRTRTDGSNWRPWRRLWTAGDFSSTNISNWNTAYGWGNHASAGYSTFSGNYNDLTNKPTIPTNNNQLTNGASYITSSALSGYLTSAAAASTYATPSYVTTQINNLVNGAPGALNTLDELAAALGDDSNFATTMTNSLASKLSNNSDATFTGNQLGFPSLGLYITNNNTGPGSHYIRGNSSHIVHGTANGNTFYLNYGNTSGGLYAYGGALYWNNNNIGAPWGSGNDGSGSGLDADLLDGWHRDNITNAEASKTWTGINASGTQAKRYHIGRLYGCPAHWDSDWQNIEFHVTAESYEASVLRYKIIGNYGGAGTQANMMQMHLTEQYGDIAGRFRLVLGSPVDAGWDHSGQDTFYMDLYAEASHYSQWKIHAKTFGHGILSSNPTSGGAKTVFYSSPTVTDISTFNEAHTQSTIRLNTGTNQVQTAQTRLRAHSNGWTGGLALISQDASDVFQIHPDNNGYMYVDKNWYFTGDIHVGSIGQKVWHAGNDGSGSGLDADTIHGIVGTHINRGTNTSGVFPGTNGYNLNDVFTGIPRAGFVDAWAGTNFPPSTSHIQGIQVRHATSTHYGWQLFGQYDQTGKLYHRAVSNNSWGNWATIWSSANDGSGSGLDADLLDGLQPSALSVNAANESHMVTGSAFATTSSPGSVLEYQQAASISDTRLAPTGDWHNSIRMGHGNPYNYYSNTIAIQMTGSGSGTMRTQLIHNNVPQGWRTVWDSSNDGSGSGLDADTLDGIQASGFALVGGGTSYRPVTAGLYGIGHGSSTLPIWQYNSGNPGYGIAYTEGSPDVLRLDVSGNLMSGTADVEIRPNDLRVNGQTVATQSWVNSQGFGSSSDADTVDGIHGTSLLRSDAADTFTGTLTMGTQHALVANNYGRGVYGLYASTRHQHVWSMGTAYNLADNGTSPGNLYGISYTHTNVGTGYGANAANGLGHQLNGRANGTLQWALGEGIWSAVTGNVWGASNDGSGSGLDADLLDGLQLHTGRNNEANKVVRTDQHGYIQAGWINTTSGDDGNNIPARIYASHDGYLRYLDLASFRSRMNVTAKTGYQGRESNTTDTNYWTGAMGWGAVNMSDMFAYGSGFIDAWGSPANRPPVGTHFNGFQSLHYSASNTYHHGMQMAMAAGNPSNTFLRGWWANGGSGYGWQKIWTDGNDGSGSGLDADLLDGYHSATSGGNINIRTHANGYLQPENWIKPANGTGLFYSAGVHFYEVSNNMYSSTGYTSANQGTLWGSSNDGSGSGLDADTVDGIQGGSLLRSDTADTINDAVVITQRGRFGTGTSNQNTNSGSIAYDWGYQEAGTWSHPYPDLVIGYHTGMQLGGHKNYNGTRFFNDHPKHGSPTMIFSVGNGDDHIRATSNIYAYTSDKRLKENFRTIENAVDKVKSLGGYIFDWREDMMAKYEFEPDQKKDDAGVIAQDVLKVMPAAVQRAPFDYDPNKKGHSKSGEEFMTVQYEKMVPLLIEAIKEQQKQIDELKAKLENK